MAVPVFTNLATAASSTDATSYTTASISPTANRVLLMAVAHVRLSSATPATPTLSGGGVSTWTLVGTATRNTDQRVSVFRADTGSSPSSGTITIDFGGETQNNCSWSVLSAADCLRTGTNAADCIAQALADGWAATGTALSVTLGSALGASDNRILVFGFRSAASATVTWGTGFTAISGATASASGNSLAAASGRDGSSQTATGTWSSGGPHVEVSVEVVGDTGDPPPDPAASVTGGWFGR